MRLWTMMRSRSCTDLHYSVLLRRLRLRHGTGRKTALCHRMEYRFLILVWFSTFSSCMDACARARKGIGISARRGVMLSAFLSLNNLDAIVTSYSASARLTAPVVPLPKMLNLPCLIPSDCSILLIGSPLACLIKAN